VTGHRQPVLLRFYRRFLDDQESASFIAATSASYNCGTLERMASSGGMHQRRAATLALGFIGDYNCNATLGRALWDDDRGVRMIAEEGIPRVWLRDGCPSEQSILRKLTHCNNSQQYRQALSLSDQLLDVSPHLAEAHHQQAIAYFHLAADCESLRSAAQAAELNPYHFLAVAKMGECHARAGEFARALECFERALRLNPNREDFRALVIQLKRSTH
jgi:tetratricopeptide (TPR) repeat protein